MPRANKAVKRQKINAAKEFKKGNKEEAYKLWTTAAKAAVDLKAKKKAKSAAAE